MLATKIVAVARRIDFVWGNLSLHRGRIEFVTEETMILAKLGKMSNSLIGFICLMYSGPNYWLVHCTHIG